MKKIMSFAGVFVFFFNLIAWGAQASSNSIESKIAIENSLEKKIIRSSFRGSWH
ncbi:MAG: hypothetical protein K6357_00760 [Elusimicrobiota bacterium]